MNKKPNILSILRESPELTKDWFTNNIISRFRSLKPTVMQLNVTLRCNSNCRTCHIWKQPQKREFSTAEWRSVLRDPLFHSIEYLLLCGGEPTIRNDLPYIAEYSLNSMPHLRKILIATNGLVPNKVTQLIAPIIALCNEKEIEITVTVSLDGIREMQDRIRGVPGHFMKTLESIVYYKQLQQTLPFRLKVGTTISRYNVADLENILQFCRQHCLSVDFYMGWISETYYRNRDADHSISISSAEKYHLIRFLKRLIDEGPMLDSNSYYYSNLIKMLEGKPRYFPCPFSNQGIVFDAQGHLYYCTNSNRLEALCAHNTLGEVYFHPKHLAYRREIRRSVCPTCVNSCLTGVAAQKAFFPLLSHLLEKGRQKANFK